MIFFDSDFGLDIKETIPKVHGRDFYQAHYSLSSNYETLSIDY